MKKHFTIISIALSLYLSCSMILPPKKPDSGAGLSSAMIGLIQTDINRVISINDVSPGSGFIGDTVSINGSNLDKIEKIGFPSAASGSYDFFVQDSSSQSKIYSISAEFLSRTSSSVKIKIPAGISGGLFYAVTSTQSVSSSLFTLKRRFFISNSTASPTDLTVSYTSSAVVSSISKFNCNGDSARPAAYGSRDTYYALLGYFIPKLSASFYTDSSNPYASFTTSTGGSIYAGQYGLNSSGNAWYGTSSTNYSSSGDCSGWSSSSGANTAYVQNLSGILNTAPSTTAACNTAAKVICIQFSY